MSATPPSSSEISDPVWHLGFTGHRQISNPAVIEGTIRDYLKTQLASHPGLIAISSFADGADRLFVRAVLACQIPWIAVSPLAIEDFLTDFDARSVEEARRLLDEAADVCTPDGQSFRPHAYRDAGLLIVQESNSVLAVWDGEDAHGTGGTAEIVQQARIAGLDVDRIDSCSGGLSRLDPMKRQPSAPGIPPTREDFLRHHRNFVLPELMQEFEMQDQVANEKAPRVRKLTLWMVLLEALAAIAALTSLTLKDHKIEALIFALGKTALVGAAVWIAWHLRHRRERAEWLGARVKAELCRSTICTWIITGKTPYLKHLGALDFEKYMKWLRFVRLRGKPHALHSRSLQENKLSYRRFRLWDQLEGYYRKQATTATRLVKVLIPVHDIAARLALILSLCGLFYEILEGQAQPPSSLSKPESHWIFALLKLAPVALPSIATWAVTWMAVTEAQRRQRRYSAMVQRLEALDRDLEDCATQASLERAITQTERILLNELVEWYGSTQTLSIP